MTPLPAAGSTPAAASPPAAVDGAAEPSTPADPAAEPRELPRPPVVAEEIPPAIPTPELDDSSAPTLTQVVNSVRNNFPLIREAAAARVIASGETLAAIGAFDHKLDGYSNGQPLDFFQNSWHVWGVERDTYWGGKIGAGYKLGRGSFEPWFLERETNDGGELSLKLQAPIGRDVAIDANRAELWRARLERDRVEPFIRAQVIGAVREGSIAYWDWIASGANL
ncbi:MAG: transporter, partial [Planctomycetota bacterium]